jgi:hypothetical protein
MRQRSRRVHLPAGVLRRFRLPEPATELAGRAAPRTSFRRHLAASLWVALLFALLTSLLYWLGSSEAWQLGVGQRLAGPAPSEAASQAAAEKAGPPPLTRGTPRIESPRPPPVSPSEVPAPPDPAAKPRPKPALKLDGHRLRPVIEWRDRDSERPPSMRPD